MGECKKCDEDHATSECPYGRDVNAILDNAELTAVPRMGPRRVEVDVHRKCRETESRLQAELKRLHHAKEWLETRLLWSFIAIAILLVAGLYTIHRVQELTGGVQ